MWRDSTESQTEGKLRTLRELHDVTERPNTEPKPTPSALKNWANRRPVFFRCRFRFGVSVEPDFLSPMLGVRETEQWREGRRESDGGRERESEGVRESAREGERVRGGERESDRDGEGEEERER